MDGDEEIEQDDSLVRTQGVTGHRGQWRGEPAGQQHQQAVWGLHTGQVMCHQQWQSCVAFSLKSSSVRMSPPWVPLSLCVCRDSSAIVDCDEERDQDRALVRVRGVAGYRGRRRGWREGLPHQPANRLGHVDIVQTSVLDSAGRPRAGFGVGDDVDDVVFYGSNRKRTPLSSQINPNPFTAENQKSLYNSSSLIS